MSRWCEAIKGAMTGIDSIRRKKKEKGERNHAYDRYPKQYFSPGLEGPLNRCHNSFPVSRESGYRTDNEFLFFKWCGRLETGRGGDGPSRPNASWGRDQVRDASKRPSRRA